MPEYQLHRLAEEGGDPAPVNVVVFSDAVAMRLAMGDSFPDGCDVWQGARFVGRIYRPAPDPTEVERP